MLRKERYDMSQSKWLEEVKEALTENGGVASLSNIYQYIFSHFSSSYKDEAVWKAQIRRIIYLHSSDCDIYNGEENLFMSEDGKGNGVWRIRTEHPINNRDDLLNLPIGATVNATQISLITGVNQVKGIHPINLPTANAVVLCTIGGASYANEWVQKPDTLKYYLEGRVSEGKKTYNPNIKSNSSVSNSSADRPILIFVRNHSKEKFTYYGKFVSQSITKEADGGMYFILQRLNTSFKIGELISSEDDEGFPEGRIKERLHKSRERNQRLVKAAKNSFKEIHGHLYCEVCGFDFEKFYGPGLGNDFIEAHHKLPISELNDGDTTQISDLAMVCSNCHRMLHKSRPWKTPTGLKSIISNMK